MSFYLEDSSVRSSSRNSSRKDVDYKLLDSGISLACVANSPDEEKPADVADSDMPQEVQRYAVAVTRDAVRAHSMFREIARYVKRAMDSKFGQCWQCHVGREFGVRVSHVPGSYMILNIGGQAVMIYRTW